METRGRKVLIIGASEGIDAACALEFSRRGARLILTSRREAPLRTLAKHDDRVIAGDLADPAFREGLAVEAAADILVNNAGAAAFGSVLGGDKPATRSASKSALTAMTVSLGAELSGSGVNAFAVRPGYVRTSFGDNRLSVDVPEYMRRAALFGESPEERAKAIVRGVERNAGGACTPLTAKVIVLAHRCAPGLVEWGLSRRQAALGKMSQQQKMTENVE